MYQLMNRDTAVATFDFDKASGGNVATLLAVCHKLPYGCTEQTFSAWLANRYAAKHRGTIDTYLREKGIDSVKKVIDITHGLSLNDTFWVRKPLEYMCWQDVSLYMNKFDEVVEAFAFVGEDMPSLHFPSTSPSLGTDGNFAKCWKREPSGVFLYKRGSEGGLDKGLEPYNETLASYVYKALDCGIPYVLVDYRGKKASKCRLFSNEHFGFVQYGMVFRDPFLANLYSVEDFYRKNDWYDQLAEMLVADAIVFNIDRHTGNFGFMFDTESLELNQPALCFDYNLALFPREIATDFADVNSFICKAKPKLGDDFVTVAKDHLTDTLRNELLNLRGFEYPDISDEVFPKLRIDWLTQLSNQQIDKILGKDTSPVYVNPASAGTTNTYRYMLKFNMTAEQFREDAKRLTKTLGVSTAAELEDRIVDLL